MGKTFFGPLLILLLLLAAPACAQSQKTTTSLRFTVTLARELKPSASAGRLFVVVGRKGKDEPRLEIGETGLDAAPVLARDVENFTPAAPQTLDAKAIIFPLNDLADLPAGEYEVQALYDSNRDVKSPNAAGNLYSDVRRVRLDAARGGDVALELRHKVPPETLPPDTEYVKYIKIQSKLLSDFHHRPIYLRAGVILPRGYAQGDSSQRYPLRVHIGGYGESFTRVAKMMSEGAEFRRAWEAPDAPPLITLHLDGDGPFGDCYQVNSANNGPYGDALTRELIPHVENRFRALARPEARFLDGGSTGGWVSLALQIFYPDYFGGAWSSCPDGVDFRGFQLINIYEDRNAYVNARGFERPSARELNGDVRFTMRHECQLENVMGAGDSWALSGGQWGAWNAAYGPRGADGQPVPLWDPRTGEINRAVVEHWKKYDLRLVLAENWPTLGPKLRGKIHIAIGEADNYFLNNAVHLLDDFLREATPAYGGTIVYAPGKGHCWSNLSEAQLIREMTNK